MQPQRAKPNLLQRFAPLPPIHMRQVSSQAYRRQRTGQPRRFGLLHGWCVRGFGRERLPGKDVLPVGVWGGYLDLFDLVAGFEVLDDCFQVPIQRSFAPKPYTLYI